MATQVKEKQASKNDAFIEAQLANAQGRVRLIDLLSAVIGFVGGTLAFAVLMIFLDKRFVLPDGVRQLALLAYFAGAVAYLWFTILQPLRWRVNPHYAARQLEQTLPGTRNHVINWLDLHGEKVPSVLKTTLGQRAAKDLSRANVDAAISNRRALLVGAAAGFFSFLLVTLFFLYGPAPFASLFGRAFAPFGGTGRIASRTQVAVLRPQDTTVTIGNAVTIVAQVGGRVPNARDKDAPCLLYRHDESEPYRKRYLQADESDQEWAATISPVDVRNGFFYKVSAGDAETPEYQVAVRATPLLAEFEAKYRYRPYVGRAERTRTTRKLEDLRGTEVIITAWTNRTIKEGLLEFEGEDGVGDLIRTERVDDEPKALRFRIVLDRGGKYRIRFTSTEGESYSDSTAYDVAVFLDHPPQVKLTEPAKDVTLPANGQLELKGEASDDFGIASMSLHLHVVGGTRLRMKPYLPDKLGTPNFGTPRNVEYRDLLELSSLKHANGLPLELKPGTEIEYWLEAADACDYLRPNVTASRPRWKITIAEPDKDQARQQKEREEASAKQKEHEAKQAEQMKKEQAEREKKKREEEEQEKKEQEKKEKEKKEKSNSNSGKSNSKDPNSAEQKDPNSKNSGESKPNENNEPKDNGKSPQEQKKEDETKDKANELKNALDKKEGKRNDKSTQDKPGEGRDADSRPGKGKDQGEKKPGDADGKDNKPGESRGEGGQDSKNPAGSKKQEGGKAGEQGSARGESRPEPGSPKGESKPQAAKNEAGKQSAGQSKDCPAPAPGPGNAKSGGNGDPSKGAGERKSEGAAKPGDQAKQGEGRDSGNAGKPNDQKPGEGKQGANAGSAGRDGQSKPGSPKGGSGKSGQSDSGKKSDSQDKPTDPSGDPKANQGERKGEGNKGDSSRAAKAKRSDVEDLIRKMQNGDTQTRNEAKRDLEDVKDKAQDPDARDAAKKALEQNRRDNQPGQNKPSFGGGTGEKGEKKTGENAVPKESGTGKDGQSSEPGEKGTVKSAGKNKTEGDGPPKEGEESPGKGKAPGSGAGDTPGTGSTGDRSASDGSGNDDGMKTSPEKPAPHRPSMLQLEEFRKKVDKNILKDMKMSPEQFAKFLKDYEELAKSQPKDAADKPEEIARPQTGGTLPTIASRPSSKNDGAKKDGIQNEGRPQAPPGYRESYADFLRRLLPRSADGK